MSDDLAPGRFSSPLAERLLRRATEPVGVTDVRGSQDRYARATSWPRKHVSLLDRVVSRHGSEGRTNQGAEQVFARPAVALMPAIEAPQSSRATALARAASDGGSPSAPERTRAPEAPRQGAGPRQEVHAGPAMRAAPLARSRSPLVSRSVSAPAAPADSTPAAGAGPVSREVVVGPPMRAVHASGTTDLRGAPRREERDPVTATPSAPVHVQRAVSAEVAAPVAPDASARVRLPYARSAVEAAAVPATREVGRRPPATPDATPATTMRAPEIGRPPVPSSSVFVQRRPAVPEVRTADATTVTPTELTVARSRAPIAPAVAETATTVLDAGLRTPSPSSTPDRSTPASSTDATDREHTRGAGQAQDVHVPTTRPRTDTARTAASAPPLLLSRPASPVVQRAAADPPSSEIVWRKGGTSAGGGVVAGASPAGRPSPFSHSSGTPFLPAPPSTIARASEPGSGGGSMPASIPHDADRSARRGPDASQLMEQVTRRLLRQIAVERERRGGSGWP